MTSRAERANTVSPQKEFAESSLNPMHDETIEPREELAGPDSWDAMAKKFEELRTTSAEHFENIGRDDQAAPPIIKAPERPTKEEWERHQATHTPHAAWCPHCMAARNARRGNPTHGRKNNTVPDTEESDGPTKVSLDYMYLHQRAGKHVNIQHNPPYLVVMEHKFGRRWAHQVPNKGTNDEAHWVHKRVLQELENSGFGKTMVLLKHIKKRQLYVYSGQYRI